MLETLLQAWPNVPPGTAGESHGSAKQKGAASLSMRSMRISIEVGVARSAEHSALLRVEAFLRQAGKHGHALWPVLWHLLLAGALVIVLMVWGCLALWIMRGLIGMAPRKEPRP